MKTYEFGDPASDIVLVQPVDDHDLEGIGNEFAAIARHCSRRFRLVAVRIRDWNDDLSPWEAPAVFGKENFGSGASKTLCELLKLCGDKSRTYYIGGYSLAGLFALLTADAYKDNAVVQKAAAALYGYYAAAAAYYN